MFTFIISKVKTKPCVVPRVVDNHLEAVVSVAFASEICLLQALEAAVPADDVPHALESHCHERWDLLGSSAVLYEILDQGLQQVALVPMKKSVADIHMREADVFTRIAPLPPIDLPCVSTLLSRTS